MFSVRSNSLGTQYRPINKVAFNAGIIVPIHPSQIPTLLLLLLIRTWGLGKHITLCKMTSHYYHCCSPWPLCGELEILKEVTDLPQIRDVFGALALATQAQFLPLQHLFLCWKFYHLSHNTRPLQSSTMAPIHLYFDRSDHGLFQLPTSLKFRQNIVFNFSPIWKLWLTISLPLMSSASPRSACGCFLPPLLSTLILPSPLGAWWCAQSCPTLCGPMDCSLPHSSAHGIFQARILEWVAISCSRGSS